MAAERKQHYFHQGHGTPTEHKRLKTTRHAEDETQALLCGKQI